MSRKLLVVKKKENYTKPSIGKQSLTSKLKTNRKDGEINLFNLMARTCNWEEY